MSKNILFSSGSQDSRNLQLIQEKCGLLTTKKKKK